MIDVHNKISHGCWFLEHNSLISKVTSAWLSLANCYLVPSQM